MQSAISTPWGIADSCHQYAPGVIFYSTPRHGGFYLDNEANNKIPVEFRSEDGWYEEDVEANIVEFFLKEHFPGRTDSALAGIKRWMWRKWEAFTGEILLPGESYTKDEFIFNEQNKDNFVVFSAVGYILK